MKKINNPEKAKVDPKKGEEAPKRREFFGFIPYRLEVERRPELKIFPLNVLFANFGIIDGVKAMGSALYEPDLSSFWYDEVKQEYSMTYHNKYGGDSWLVITYSEPDEVYRGSKFVDGKLVGSAFYKRDWKMFFFHLGILGLSEGERCLFDEIGVAEDTSNN